MGILEEVGQLNTAQSAEKVASLLPVLGNPRMLPDAQGNNSLFDSDEALHRCSDLDEVAT